MSDDLSQGSYSEDERMTIKNVKYSSAESEVTLVIDKKYKNRVVLKLVDGNRINATRDFMDKVERI